MAKNKGTGAEMGPGRIVPPRKSVCPVSRREFEEHAKPLAVKIGDELKSVSTKSFTTGSLGWYLNEKATVLVNGVPVRVQAQLQFTIIGSKDLP